MVRAALFCLLILCSLASAAHEVKPGLLQLTEVAEGRFDVLWKRPVTDGRALAIAPRFDSGVLDSSPSTVMTGAAADTRLWRDVPIDLTAGSVRIDGLERTITDVLVSVQRLNGDRISAVVTAKQPLLDLAQPAGLALHGYLQLGFGHILGGADHLLFVFALLLLLRGWPLLVKTITAFTVAHSITLALITLDLVQPPIALIETLVALSIAVVGVEVVNVQRGRGGLMQRQPWLIAFAFGLLHGSAFGGELVQIGLPPDDVAAALLLFNLGIEAGQLLFIAVVLGLWRLFHQPLKQLPPRSHWLPPYAIGSAGAFWFFQRLGELTPAMGLGGL